PPRQTPTQAPVVVQKPVTPPQNPKMPPLALNVPDITETVLPQINAQPSAPPPPASPPPPAAAVTQPSAENSIAAPQLSPQDGDVIEVPVRIANGPRLLATRLIDATLAGLAGALFAFFETVVSGNDIVIESVSFADRLAQWIYYHPTAAGHGFLAAVALGAVHNFIGGLSGGRTIGRRLTHTVLVRMDGKKVHVGTILLRSLGSLISLAAFGAGFFWVLVDRHRRTWHDILAGTVVVNSRIKKP
ncbi:RDD family protein, partial [Myxococcota bacterium]|nr:RDD family protein [Myxococcota bacterium]